MNDLNKFLIEIESTGRAIEVWQKGKGPDVVFLHGAGGIQAFGPDLEALAKSYRVTVPLFPGFGQSTGIDDIDSVQDAVLHIFDLLKALKISKPHLVGHSMGAMLAAEMAATCPNEVGRLALVAPVGLWDDAHPVLDFFAVMPQDIVKYIFYDKKHPLAVAMAAIPSPDDNAIVDIYVNYMKGLAAAGRLLWPIPDRGLKKRIYRITAPTLIIWGESDKLVPVYYGKEFQKRIAGSRLKTIKEASHMVMAEQPKAVAGAIGSFLSETLKPGKPEAAAKITPIAAAAPPAPPDQRAAIAAAAERSAKKHIAEVIKPTPEAAAAKKAAAPEKPAPPKKAEPAKKPAAPKKPAPAKKAAPAKKVAAPKKAAPKPAKKSKPAPKKKAAAKKANKPAPKPAKSKAKPKPGKKRR